MFSVYSQYIIQKMNQTSDLVELSIFDIVSEPCRNVIFSGSMQHKSRVKRKMYLFHLQFGIPVCSTGFPSCGGSFQPCGIIPPSGICQVLCLSASLPLSESLVGTLAWRDSPLLVPGGYSAAEWLVWSVSRTVWQSPLSLQPALKHTHTEHQKSNQRTFHF